MHDANRSHRILVKSSAVIMAATLFSRVFGLVRTKVINFHFPQEILDPFWSAYKIPNTLREMLAEGALSVAFIPVFTAFLIKHGEDAAAELASNVLNILLAAVIVLTGAGMLFAHLFMPLYVTGFSGDTVRIALAVDLTRIMLPFLVFASSGAVVMGVLNGKKHFFAPAFAPVFFSLGMIAMIMLFHKSIGPHVLGWGVLGGGLCQLLFQLPFLRGRGIRYRPCFNLRHPGVREVLRLMAPAALALGVVQLNQLIAPFFASYAKGGVSALQNAILLVQMPQGVFAIALSTVLLPTLSEHATRGDNHAFRRGMQDGLGLVLLFSIPSALFFIFFGREVIDAVFAGGQFTATDLDRTAPALLLYSTGLIGMGGTVLANRFFYALRDMKTPFLVALGSVAFNLLLNLVFHFTNPGAFALIALSNSLSVTANFVLLILLVQRRMGRFRWGHIFLESGKITIAGCAMAAAAILAWHGLAGVLPQTFFWKIGLLLLATVAATGTFYLIARLLGVHEIALLLSHIRKRPPTEDVHDG